MSHPTRKEFMAELQEWSNTAQKHFSANAQILATTTDCVYTDTILIRLQQNRDTKMVADSIYKLLQCGNGYERVITMCRDKSVSAFRAGNKNLGETWWDWSHNAVLNCAEAMGE
jgi:hypothetical protein